MTLGLAGEQLYRHCLSPLSPLSPVQSSQSFCVGKRRECSPPGRRAGGLTGRIHRGWKEAARKAFSKN